MNVAWLIPAQSDPGAAMTAFLGHVLLAVAGALFGYYAYRNLAHNRLESRAAFWRYLVAVGLAGLFYGCIGALDAVANTRWTLALSHGALLVFIVSLSFAMREVYVDTAAVQAARERTISMRTIRRIEAAFVVVIALELVAVLALGQVAIVSLVEGAGSVAFAAYGVTFGERVQSRRGTQGTPLDTLVRHLLPALICAGCLGLGDLAIGLGLDAVFVRSTQNVFLVMVGAFLITATIRLQQNVEGF